MAIKIIVNINFSLILIQSTKVNIKNIILYTQYNIHNSKYDQDLHVSISFLT